MQVIPATWRRSKSFFRKPLWWCAAWAAASLFWAGNTELAARGLSLLIQSLLLAGAAAFFLERKFFSWVTLFWFTAAASFVEAVIGIIQVVHQGSVGLFLLGESHLDIFDVSVAKTIIGGGRLLRAYGTMAHPNILAAALTAGLASTYYLFQRVRSAPGRAVMSIVIFVQLLGLLFTFSRAGWLAAAIATILFLWFWRRFDCRALGVVMIASFVFLTLSFFWLFAPKLHLSSMEPSVALRAAYIKIGWVMVREHPLLGVGIGNQVRAAVQEGLYRQAGVQIDRLWQPIHNLYLLVTVELGIIGAMLFAWLLLSVLFTVITQRRYRQPEIATILSLWLSFLIFGLFDHFFWTIPAGQFLFWAPTILLLSSRS